MTSAPQVPAVIINPPGQDAIAYRVAEFAGFRREATLRGWERIDGVQKDADCYAQLHSEWVPG